jgi:hypothetical protein
MQNACCWILQCKAICFVEPAVSLALYIFPTNPVVVPHTFLPPCIVTHLNRFIWRVYSVPVVLISLKIFAPVLFGCLPCKALILMLFQNHYLDSANKRQGLWWISDVSWLINFYQNNSNFNTPSRVCEFILQPTYSKICDIRYWIIRKFLLTGKLTKSPIVFKYIVKYWCSFLHCVCTLLQK